MTKEDKPLTLRILTVNTHKGFTVFNRRFILHELRDAIRATRADIVFLQEVLGAHHHHAEKLARWPATSQYEFLADTIWPQFAYGRNAVYPHGHHGNAILSKFPITSYENIDISVDKQEKRGMLHCVLQPPGYDGQIHLICVHMGLRERHRHFQLSDLCRYVNEDIPPDVPLVIAGDFNDWRQIGQRMLVRTCGMYEVFREKKGKVARTFPARLPLLRLDRIYVRNISRFEAMSLARRPWSQLSDHAPLAVELAI
ncbi:endonuclease/exonuclease/phosphatase family protein [Allopusillimonas ginsengisoli]|uniref:endonuclease/exonuclease/phosphatase family protein n=1 Tax=Allopusillimonas ginsengisoli TaxID=453575 RepID=UPI0010207248|nr:endonuclease/exonuclease/phosphatase family protein [Allopusillimonas ginsengisoli]TEA77670.1 endonuclease/exonuclease/phosphatase family protein [Allopusillimonas ginsengisoli]